MEPFLEKLILTCGNWKHYGAGELIFVQGERAKGAHVVDSGKVRVMLTTKGKTIYEHEAIVGDVMGLPALFSCKPYSLTAQVTEDAVIGFIPRDPFMTAVQTDTIFGLRCLRLVSREMQFARLAI
jgi:CRP-like cAMP-binding protein